MADSLRPADYIGYRDAAHDILGRHSGAEAITAFGLDELLDPASPAADLTPVYAFLEAQGQRCADTPALARLGLTGTLTDPASTGTPPLLLGSALGNTRLIGVPGRLPSSTVAVDLPGTGLVALPDVSGSVQPPAFPGADDYVTVLDPRLVPVTDATTLVPERELNGRGADMVSRTQLGASAELLGVIDRMLTDAITYSKQRQQFGRPLASYQSLQHLLAWAATERHQLISLYDVAVGSVVRGPLDPQLARAVKALAGRTLHAVAQTSIQVTGGISFTWEYPQHVQHRRGLALDQLAGASADLIAAIGRQTRTEGTVPDLVDLHELAKSMAS
ncbi:acyl-CoA dehydrogenase family protein [Streptomyces sp. NPDC090075]|uniref:acyl-CoA dehydrogenase family protein n=1 Tax=Streptomyces sp. NPDC090075 TaxID=3365937 RepID=UPI003828EECF